MKYIIGDVHGELVALESLVSEIRKTDSEAEFYFAGDFVDRGPESKKVVELVMELKGKAVRGNHDDIMALVSNNKSLTYNGEGIEAAQQTIWFMQFGMGRTLESYGVKASTLYNLVEEVSIHQQVAVPDIAATTSMIVSESDKRGTDVDKIMEEIRSAIPENHKNFFRDLPLAIEEDTFFIAHAHLDVISSGDLVECAEKNAFDTLWGRFTNREIAGAKGWGKIGFFGHTPVDNYGMPSVPIVGEDMVLLDTGATFGNRLSAWCVEEGMFICVNQDGSVYKHNYPAYEFSK